jgi:ribosome-binding protein aMBF1 (putative translation factor)
MQSPEVRDAYEMARRAHEFGVVIRSARERRGLTQADLAKLIATSQSAVARLEAGGVQPTLETLSKLTGALKIRLVVGPDGVVSEGVAAAP